MEFPSRKAIHEVVEVLDIWGIHKIIKDGCPGEWCLEMIRNTNLKISHGCTKIAVDFGDDDWVLKIPYGGCDFCRDEAENFALIRREHLKKFFAPCFFYGVIRRIPIYLQRKVEKNAEAVSGDCYTYAFAQIERQPTQSDEEYSEEVADYVDCDMEDADVVSAVIGWDERLLDFIAERGINDLHQGNFGFLNNEAVIFDYSGY